MIFLKYFPFSLHWIVRHCLDNHIKTILDLGCGDGSFTKDVSSGENWQITGVELYDDSIKKARRSEIYKRVVKASITKLPPSIINKKYDVVLLIHVIEHLDKKKVVRFLKEWEKLATKKVVVSTPVGFMEFDRVEMKYKEKNKLQKHLSGWHPREFRERGYKVYGQGVKLIYGQQGLIRKLHPVFWPLLIGFSYFLAPFVFFFPSMSSYMIAVKNMEYEIF